MEVELLSGPEEFLSVTEEFRSSAPVLTNVLSSVPLGVAQGHRRYDACFWWVVRDRGRVCGAAMRTHPFALLLSPMPEAAARSLAGPISEHDPSLPGVHGPSRPVRSLVDALAERRPQRQATASGAQLIYELGALTMPQVPGHGRRGTPDDEALAQRWNELFHEELGGTHTPEAVAHRLREGMTFFWDRGGRTVSLAGHAEPVDVPGGTLTRVGPVFTPREERRHGYAAAVTAALSRDLLDRGSRVMLYTDAANPTSNGVYQRLGYRQVGDVEIWEFL